MATTTVAPNVAARRDRHRARRILWAESSLERVRGCGYSGVSPEGGVGVKVTGTVSAGDRTAGFSGVATCGSVWACPVCSAKIAARRQQEIEQAITAWQAQGGRVVLVTLTMRHARGMRLKTLWDSLSYAWGRVTSGRGWKDDQAVYGVEGWCRVVEATHGENGWHVHVHALLFVSPALLGDWQGLGDRIFARWQDGLWRRSLDAVAAFGGLDVREVTARDASGARLGEYFVKSLYRRGTPAGAAWEVAGGMGKAARGRNRTPFEYLRSVVEDADADALDVWHEWEQESRNRRQLTWSQGFRDRVQLEIEQTDAEIAEQGSAGSCSSCSRPTTGGPGATARAVCWKRPSPTTPARRCGSCSRTLHHDRARPGAPRGVSTGPGCQATRGCTGQALRTGSRRRR